MENWKIICLLLVLVQRTEGEWKIKIIDLSCKRLKNAASIL